MDKRENIKLKMFQGLEEVPDRNKGTIATIPAFQISYDDVRETIADIVETDKKYLTVTNGVTSSKDQTRDMDFLSAAKSVHSAISEHTSGLKKYGVSKEDIENLGTKINTYEKAIEVQEDSFAQSKAARQKLGELFDTGDDIVNLELDPMLDRIKEAHAEFYTDYQKNRILKNF